MEECIRKLNFCAGHRVMGHENKCAHLHGHEYMVEVTACGKLDGVGRVIDFSVIKEKLGTWIDRNWDHGFILNSQDVDALNAIVNFQPREGIKQKLYQLPDINPTAENLAMYLRTLVCPPLFYGTGVVIKHVVVHETPNCRGISYGD